jgi:acyl carrier protein
MHDALNSFILARVVAAIQAASTPGNVQITAETRFDADLGFDSLDLLEVAMCLEETFEIEFSRETVLQFAVVSDVVAYLSRHFFRDVAREEPIDPDAGAMRGIARLPAGRAFVQIRL